MVETLTPPQVKFLPYGRQHISQADIEAVIAVLKSDWLTQGPAVPAFEKELAERVGAKYAVACASGTAALHLAMLALGIGAGDEIVTSANTFLASANCARFVGAGVRFVDINVDTGLIDCQALERVLRSDTDRRIKVVIPVHFAGQPADLPAIYNMARQHGAWVVDDACHAIGATYDHEGKTCPIGSNRHSDLTVFSFHPVKHVAMGEGGAVTTPSSELAEKLARLRCHGIRKNSFINNEMATATAGEINPWYYEMQELGYNYRLTDIQAALGTSQLRRLSWSLRRRQEITACYRRLLQDEFADGTVRPLAVADNITHAYHLFVVLIEFERLGVSRARVMTSLRENGIGTQVHYIPVPLQPYYRRHCGTGAGDFPNTEKYYARALSLPMYPDLSDTDCERVIGELKKALQSNR